MHWHRLSLEPLTFPDLCSSELVSVAASAGFDYVSLFVQAPGPEFPPPPLIGSTPQRRELDSRLAETGIKVLTVECFNLTPDAEIESFRPALATGAELGASDATVIVWDNFDRDDVVRKFARLCRLAAQYGLRANLEFMALSKSLSSMEAAPDLVARAGEPNGGLVVDMLHLIRTGSSPAALARLDPALIGKVQICDGPPEMAEDRQFAEAGYGRLAPGDGAFPIRDLLAILRPEIVVGLEVPQRALAEKGVSVLDRAKSFRSAAHRLMAQP